MFSNHLDIYIVILVLVVYGVSAVYKVFILSLLSSISGRFYYRYYTVYTIHYTIYTSYRTQNTYIVSETQKNLFHYRAEYKTSNNSEKTTGRIHNTIYNTKYLVCVY